jgi:hypothetical protein
MANPDPLTRCLLTAQEIMRKLPTAAKLHQISDLEMRIECSVGSSCGHLSFPRSSGRVR